MRGDEIYRENRQLVGVEKKSAAARVRTSNLQPIKSNTFPTEPPRKERSRFSPSMTTARPKTEKSKCRPQPPPTPTQHRTSRTRPEHVGFGASGARFRKSEKSDPARGRTWDPKCAKRAPYRLSYHGKRGSHSGAGGEGGEQEKGQYSAVGAHGCGHILAVCRRPNVGSR